MSREPVVNCYAGFEWLRFSLDHFVSLYPFLRYDIGLFKTCGYGMLAPLVLNLIPVQITSVGFQYDVTDVFPSEPSQLIVCTDVEIALFYHALNVRANENFETLMMDLFTGGFPENWLENVPHELVRHDSDPVSGPAKVLYSCLRASVGVRPKGESIHVAVVGSVLVNSGNVYILFARAMMVLGHSVEIDLFDPNEVPRRLTMTFAGKTATMVHIKKKVSHVDLVKYDLILDDAGTLVAGQLSNLNFSIKGSRALTNTVIENQPFYQGTEYRTIRSGMLLGPRYYRGLCTCVQCTKVSQLANSLSPDDWFGTWLVILFALAGIEPCVPVPGIQDILERGRLFRELNLKQNVDIRTVDPILEYDSTRRWRAALSLILEGEVGCSASHVLSIHTSLGGVVQGRSIQPVKIVSYVSSLVKFLSDKKVFIHDVVEPELFTVKCVVPQDANVIIAEEFPPTRVLTAYPLYWISPRQSIDTQYPYRMFGALKGSKRDFYMFQYDVTVSDVNFADVTEKNAIDRLGKWRGQSRVYSGENEVILVSSVPGYALVSYSGSSFHLMEARSKLGEEFGVAVSLIADYLDGNVIPRFRARIGTITYYEVYYDGIPLMPMEDVPQNVLAKLLPSGVT